MELNQFDIIIVGAGATGIMAALEFGLAGKKTAVLEAKDDIGGRARSMKLQHFERPVEAGAEFIHGNLKVTQMLLKKAGINFYEVEGTMWHKKDGTLEEQEKFIEGFEELNKKLQNLSQDISVGEFIDQYLSEKKFDETRFTLKNYVEGYYAADISKASTFALREELNKTTEEQYRIEGGYTILFHELYQQCLDKEVQFYFSHPVKEISWEKSRVRVSANQRVFTARKVLITVPIGVLKSQSLIFAPALPDYEKAFAKLGYGGVIKTILQFKQPFWKNKEFTQGNDLSKMGFLFSKAAVPTWWTYYPEEVSMLTGWNGGPHAEELKDLSDEQILDQALQALSEIFSLKKDFFREQLLAWHVANWVNDPYSCGGYSYEVVNGEQAKKILRQPVEDTVYFSGEGLFDGVEIGTVNAALEMGRNTAREMIASFKS